MLANRVLLAIVVVAGVPAATVAYVWIIERLLALLGFHLRQRIRPWLWIFPAVGLLTFYLVYPVVNTVYLSFLGRNSVEPVGLANYAYVFTNQTSLTAIRNNGLWLVFMGGFTVLFGLTFAILFDRVRYESVAKSMIFLPMAVSFVAAAVIWKLQYDYRPPGAPQTGTLNGIVTALGGDPVFWLGTRSVNNFALIWVGIWVWTGFALVILSAGLKGIPVELLEAARVDGANEWQILFRITIPIMASTIAVVATTMIIFALKAFDIVYVLTNGAYGTDVLANLMYKQMFNFRDFGRASAVAVVLLLAIAPMMAFNIRRFQRQEEIR